MSTDGLDWRMDAVTTLAEPLPAAYPGGPSWPVGTLVMTSIDITKSNGEQVNFAAPSVVGMLLNSAMRAAKRATELRSELKFHNSKGPEGTLKHIGDTEKLFDMFEHMLASISFSFTALEAYCNYAIGRSSQESFEKRHKGKVTMLSRAEAERNLSTDEKLKSVLPKLIGVPTPAGKAVWSKFLSLKIARDQIIHFKSADQYPVGPRTPPDPLFRRLLENDPHEFPETVREILQYFHPNEETRPRWLDKMPAKE